jgi:hypothetical protein
MVFRAVEYFNRYAFSYVAIYGKSFAESGSEASQLFRRKVTDDSAIPSATRRSGNWRFAIGSGGLCGRQSLRWRLGGSGKLRIGSSDAVRIIIHASLMVAVSYVTTHTAVACDPGYHRGQQRHIPSTQTLL